MDLTQRLPAHRKCQWINGEAKDRDFCGKPVIGQTSWCAHHYARVFRPPKKPKSEKDLLS